MFNMPETRTEYFNSMTKKEMEKRGWKGKFARKIIRNQIAKKLGYQIGSLGGSTVAGIPPRRERKKSKDFKPIYSNQ